MNYYNTNLETVEMFTDATDAEENKSKTLSTVRNADGSISLVSYGWQEIARVDNGANTVTVFVGHYKNSSRTTKSHINLVGTLAYENPMRSLRVSGATPVVGKVPPIAKFIGHYVNFRSKFSRVEQDAKNEVDTFLGR
jgi:hypothetical protein